MLKRSDLTRGTVGALRPLTSPGIFEMILVLGLVETRKRVERAIATISG